MGAQEEAWAVEPSALFATACLYRRFGYQLEFTQRALEFSVRFFSGDAHRVNRRVVAVFGPRDGFGHVGIPVTLGPGAVDVQFYLWTPLRQPLYM